MDNLTQTYLRDTVNFGGIAMSRAQVYQWFADNEYTDGEADYWFMGRQAVAKTRSAK